MNDELKSKAWMWTTALAADSNYRSRETIKRDMKKFFKAKVEQWATEHRMKEVFTMCQMWLGMKYIPRTLTTRYRYALPASFVLGYISIRSKYGAIKGAKGVTNKVNINARDTRNKFDVRLAFHVMALTDPAFATQGKEACDYVKELVDSINKALLEAHEELERISFDGRD